MNKKRKVIMINVEKCLGCKSCEIACAVAHSESELLEEAIKESPRPQCRVNVEAVGEHAVPLQCRHCEDAPCIAVCPTGAIHRHGPDEPVLIEQDKCIGCKFCVAVCPFGVIELSADGQAIMKCDFCIERTKRGQGPACVEACPTKALTLVDEKQVSAGKRKRAAEEIVSSAQKSKKQQENTQ